MFELTCLLPLPCSARAGIAALFCEGSAYGLSHFKADLIWLSELLMLAFAKRT